MPSVRTSSRGHRLALLLAVLAMVAGCGSAPDDEPALSTASGEQDLDELVVIVASFDLATGTDQRLLAGLFTAERQLIAFGEVDVELRHLGGPDEVPDLDGAEVSQETTARFLPVPGMEPEGIAEAPVLLEGLGSGVYETRVDLDEAGVWQLDVTATLEDGQVLQGVGRFVVAEETAVPAVGEPAPRVANHTTEDVEQGLVRPEALDSRAQSPDEIPDRHLHDVRIVDAVDEGWPVVVVVSTPVYCQSRFCGPLTERVSVTATKFEDRARFVHLEVWENFEESRLNEAAAAWIQTPTDGNEPWVFVVDGDGTIVARWDNVLDLEALHDLLGELPPMDQVSAEGSEDTEDAG